MVYPRLGGGQGMREVLGWRMVLIDKEKKKKIVDEGGWC